MSDQKTCKKCKRTFDGVDLFIYDASHECVQPALNMTQLESFDLLNKLGLYSKSYSQWARESILSLDEDAEIGYQERKAAQVIRIRDMMEKDRIRDEHRQNKAAYEYQMRQMNRLKR